MEKEELKKMLKEHLTVKVNTAWIGSVNKLYVQILFDNEKISTDSVTIGWDDDDF